MIVKQIYLLTEKKNAVCKMVRPSDRAGIGASVASGEKKRSVLSPRRYVRGT